MPPGETRPRVIIDPIYGYIEIPAEITPIVNHVWLQRLRHISQTAVCSTVYPGMTGTRFEHALGAMHLAGLAFDNIFANAGEHNRRQFMDTCYRELTTKLQRKEVPTDDISEIWTASRHEFSDQFERQMRIVVQTVALLHDVGHTPFSHVLEDFFQRHVEQIASGSSTFLKTVLPRLRYDLGDGAKFHELIGMHLVQSLPRSVTKYVPWAVVLELLRPSDARSLVACFAKICSNEVDVDRIDYLMRDASNAGTQFGAIDFRRLLDSMEIRLIDNQWVFGFRERALSALESLLVCRYQYYRWVIFHWHVVATARLLNYALEISCTSPAAPDGFLRGLNFFAVEDLEDVSTRSDHDLSEVDDATVYSVLKRVKQHAQQEAYFEAPLLAVLNSFLRRTPAWAPVWKTDADYAVVAEAMASPFVDALSGILSGLAVDLSTSEDDEQRFVATRCDILAQAQIKALRTDPLVGFNQLLKSVFETADRHRRLSREINIAEQMNGLMGSIQTTLPQGQWIFAYERFEAVELESGAVLFQGDARRPLADVSDIVKGLAFTNNSRPRFYVFYLSHENNKLMRDGRSSPYESEIATVFRQLFPVVLARNYMRWITT